MIGMNLLTLTIVVIMIAAAVQQDVTFGQTKPDGKEVGVPPPRTSQHCHLKLWLLVLAGLLPPMSARAASFDCSHARSTLEVLICADAELSSLDGQVGEAYSKLRSSVPPVSKEKAELLDEQREFLKKRTEVCPLPSSPEMITCLERFYTLRLKALQKHVAVLGNQNAQLNRPPRPANGFQGQTEPDGKEVDVPSDLVATLKNDWDDPSDFDSDCSEGLRECVSATWFDLTVCDVTQDQQVSTKRLPSSANRPQQAALLVEPSTMEMTTGHTSCTFVLAMAGVRSSMTSVTIL
jgi:uncharacterized protein